MRGWFATYVKHAETKVSEVFGRLDGLSFGYPVKPSLLQRSGRETLPFKGRLMGISPASSMKSGSSANVGKSK
jgi:hypothetical protein